MSLKRVPVKGAPEGTFIKSGNPNKEAQQSEMLGFKTAADLNKREIGLVNVLLYLLSLEMYFF